MGKHRDWTEIRIDYQQNGLSLADVAKKYSVPIDTVKKAAARENWTKRKEKSAALANTKAKRASSMIQKAEKGTKQKTAQAQNGTTGEMAPPPADKERFLRVVGALLAKIEQSVALMPPEAAKELKSLSGALKDLSALAGWDKDENDLAEQRARIEKLRADTQSAQSEEARQVTIRFIDTEGAEE